jgi:hypothetical protein
VLTQVPFSGESIVLSQPAWSQRSAPFNGPFDVAAPLLSGVGAAQVEGLWIDTGFAKVASLEMLVSGAPTFEVDIWGSNAVDNPPNEYIVTIAGSATQNDTVTMNFANANVPGGTHGVLYTVPATPTINGVAAGIAAAINADAVLGPLGFQASAVAAVITITYPSVAPGITPSTTSSPGPSNFTLLTDTLSGGATETVAIAVGSNGTKISSISAAGLTALSILPRWITARLSSLSGGTTPSLTLNFHSAG